MASFSLRSASLQPALGIARQLLLLLFGTWFWQPAHAQSPPPQNAPVVEMTGNSCLLRIVASTPGRTYFMKVSTDLIHWDWLPWIDVGDGNDMGPVVTLTGTSRSYFTLEYTDDPSSDLDQDGISNIDEILTTFTSPVEDADKDLDGMPDGWEWTHGFDPNLDDGEEDADDDGRSNRKEYAENTNPHQQDVISDYTLFSRGSGAGASYSNQDPGRKAGMPWFHTLNQWITVIVPVPFVGRLEIPEQISSEIHLGAPAYDLLYSWVPQSVGRELKHMVEHTALGAEVGARASSRPADVEGGGSVQGRTLWMRAPARPVAWSLPYRTERSGNRTILDPEPSQTLFYGPEIQTGSFDFPANSIWSNPVFLVAKLETTSPEELIRPQGGGAGASETSATTLSLLPVDIEPDTGMAGVVGDVVKSAKAGSTVEHFVTPKKSTELNQEYVILKAVGVTADQITDGNANQIVQWDGGLPTDPPDPLKRRVKRDATGTGPTELKIKAKQGGAVAAQMNVWVVWCTMNAQHSRFGPADPVIYEDLTTFEGDPSNGNRFRFIIHPAAIVAPQVDAEIPDLKGAKRKPVPGDGKPFTIHMGPNPPVGDTAANKWDVSRQYSITISNPNLIPLAQLAPRLFPAWLVGQPNAADQTPVNFPADPAEGNDDPSMNDEDTNPYQERLTGQLSHSQGELSSFDAPGYSAPHIWGTVNGMKFGVRYSFREFVRLELWDGKRQSGKFWFRISDDNPWHFTFKVKFTDPLPVGSPYPKAWLDDGSEQNFGP